MTPEHSVPSAMELSPHIRAIVLVASLLIGAGMGYSEWKTALSLKADRVELDALKNNVEREHLRIHNEQAVNRHLLCRLPEVRPDSHCQALLR